MAPPETAAVFMRNRESVTVASPDPVSGKQEAEMAAPLRPVLLVNLQLSTSKWQREEAALNLRPVWLLPSNTQFVSVRSPPYMKMWPWFALKVVL